MRQFTREELARYNGKDGAPAYIACRGFVYDVSRSFLWKQGRHQAQHLAGTDLTNDMAAAPHGVDVLARFLVVGVIVETSSP